MNRSFAWLAVAAAVFMLALASVFHELWRHDPTTVIPEPRLEAGEAFDNPKKNEFLARSDQRFVVWLIARNARTLLTEPSRLFDSELCFPAENALVFGEPAITLGLIAAPAYWATRDPIATFNLLLVALALISAFAMYWLVHGWTGEPIAGIVAGLLYAFHEIKFRDVNHPYAYETAWIVLGIFFAERLLARGRWRDAAALAACGILQVGGSLYPSVAGIVVALPLATWLVVRRGLRNLPLLQLGVVLFVVTIAGLTVLGPFLDARQTGLLPPRSDQFFAPWPWFLPDGRFFLGWTIIGLVIAALSLGRARILDGIVGDPRAALVIGCLLVTSLVGGGTPGEFARPDFPNLYPYLARFIPGLDVIRGPFVLVTGTHLTACILAGIGAGGLLRTVPRRHRMLLGAAMVLLAYVDTLRPASLGMDPRYTFEVVSFEPDAPSLEFYRTLEAMGDHGPILEVPSNVWTAGASVLMAAYHRRPTSQCYGSYLPPTFEEVQRLIAELPSRQSVRASQEMGFTTVVVHGLRDANRRKAFEEFATRTDGALLRKLHGDASMAAYSILVDGARGPAP